MLERRRLKRMDSPYYLKVFNYKTEQFTGHIEDITIGGMMLTSRNPLKTSSTLKLRMVLPTIENSEREIIFKADVVWCKKDADFEFYNSGIEFQNLSPTDIRVINKFERDAWYTLLRLSGNL